MYLLLEEKKPKPERKPLPEMPPGLEALLNKTELSFKEIFNYND